MSFRYPVVNPNKLILMHIFFLYLEIIFKRYEHSSLTVRTENPEKGTEKLTLGT